MFDELYDLLAALDGVGQDPRWHPEGDALYHSLQVFEQARRLTADPTLWAAALLHDVGKAISGPDHDEVGADLLEGIASPRIVWLIRHHLCLLRDPARTRRRLRGTAWLADLEVIRRCDVAGRDPRARVGDLDDALSIVLDHDSIHLVLDQDDPMNPSTSMPSFPDLGRVGDLTQNRHGSRKEQR